MGSEKQNNSDEASPSYPQGLDVVDIELINAQCENQEATSKEQIEGFAIAYKKAKDLVRTNNFDGWTSQSIEDFILESAVLIEKRNEKGYRKVPVSFFGGGSALPPDVIGQAIKSFCVAYAEGIMTSEEAYLEFERIHPFEDGNGRLGDLLWKMDVTRKTHVWPQELPPDVFNQYS